MRSCFQQRVRDESGVVAIIVALSISTFILGFAALAVDTGIAYATKAEMQSVADRLAIAAASGLPDTTAATDAFQKSFTETCPTAAAGDRGMKLWGDEGPCAAGASFNWARNGDRADGEVEFFAPTSVNTPLDFGVLPASPLAAPANPTAVRVTLPPVTVPFSFGGYFGIDSVDVDKSATARIGTSLGAGILPFAATQADVTSGQFCVVDPTVPPAIPIGSNYSDNLPSASTSPRLRIDDPNPATVPYDADAVAPTDVKLTLILRDFYTQVRNLDVHIKTAAGPLDDQALHQVVVADGIFAWQFMVTIPLQAAGVSLQIWVTGEQKSLFSNRWRKFTSDSTQLSYDRRPTADADPCTLPQASGRGYVDLARTSPTDSLETNIRRGPQVQLYPQTLLNPVLNIVGDLCAQRIFQPKTSCVTTNGTPGFSTGLSKGLFDAKDGVNGRLTGDCGNGTTGSGGKDDLDASKLVGGAANAGMLDPRFGNGTLFRQALVSHAVPPADRGWVSGTALRCPRMAVLPVISNTPSVLDVVLSGGKEITGFVYLWIDGIDADRGLAWNGNKLRALSGYIIDPKYLPALVAGSGVVGPYLGTSMPKEATLICDLADQAAARCADAG